MFEDPLLVGVRAVEQVDFAKCVCVFSLLSAEHVAPLREELFFVRAEDIGYFEPMFSHRSGGMALAERPRSSEPSVSNGLLVERRALSDRCR